MGNPHDTGDLGIGDDLLDGADHVPFAPGLGPDLLAGLPDPNTLPATPQAAVTGKDARADPMTLHQQRTVYGETAGLYPQLVNQPGKNSVYNRSNWNPGSAADLQTARAWMAGVRLRNHIVKESGPHPSNGLEKMVWQDAANAVQASKGLQLPAGVKNFFIRQDGVGAQAPDPKLWGKDAKVYKSFGPFINLGGGDVPKGTKTYIDFYKVEP